MHRLLPLLALLLFVSAAHAQRPPTPERVAQQEAMGKLLFLVGDWEGEGWYDYNGQRAPFTGTERVEARLDSLLLLVEGRHFASIPNRPEPMLIHHAFGMFAYDADAGHYTFDTHLATGRGGTYEAHMEGDALVWTMENSQMGHVRYVIRLDDEGRWHETGHRSADGDTWTQFFEMTLRRAR